MPDATKRRRRSNAEETVDDGLTTMSGAEETAEEADQGDQRGGDADQASAQAPKVTSEIRDAIREAAIEVLRPVARNATKAAAKAVVTQGPALVKDRVGPMVSQAGGPGELAKSAVSKGGGVMGGVTEKLPGLGSVTEKLPGVGKDKDKGGKKPTGHGRGRRLPVQEYVDVAVPIDVAYDQFTQFEEFPKFMHRVEKIEQRDDSTLMWHENIWGVRRSWEAELLEQQPCERIVWRSKGGPQTVGVVTFHELSDQLTRVYVNFDFQPKGLFEKTASGLRLSRRALKSDLMRFKAFVEMRNEPTGAWRGLIEEGEVREQEDEGEERDEREEQETTSKGRSQRFKRSEADEEEDEEEEEEFEEPEAEGEAYEEEEEEEEDREDEAEEPVAEEEEEDREDEAEEPVAEEEEWADEDEEPEDEPEERPAPRRRSRGVTAGKPRSTTGSGKRR